MVCSSPHLLSASGCYPLYMHNRLDLAGAMAIGTRLTVIAAEP